MAATPHHRPQGRRRAKRLRALACGFSLVELLVVIAIVGVLISLLLPAVQAARETARRTQCMNSIRQAALAVLQYEDVEGKLPAAGRFGPRETAVAYSFQAYHVRVNLKSGTNHSWIVSVLPHMELQTLYKQFDPARHVADNPLNPQAQQPPILLCPSEQALGRMFEFRATAGAPAIPFGKANVAALVSPFHIDDYDTAGAICHYGQELRQITDGLSRTVMLSEVRTRDEPRDQRGAWALPWSGASLLSVDAHPPWYPVVSTEANQPRNAYTFDESPYGSLGFTQIPNSPHFDVLYECPDLAGEQLDGMPCTNHPGYTSAAPRSNHPGGVTAAMVDASCRFLPNDIDEIVFAYMVSVADEQVRDGL